MKGQRIHGCQDHHHRLCPEEDVAVESHWLAVDQYESADGAHHQAEHLPWKQALLNLRERRPQVSHPQQAQIHHDHQTGEQAHADDVQRQKRGIAVDRFADCDAAWKFVHPLEPRE